MKTATILLTLLYSLSAFALGGGHAGSFSADEPLDITPDSLKVAMTDVLECYGIGIEDDELGEITLGNLRSSFNGSSYAKEIANGPMQLMLACAHTRLTNSPYNWKIDRSHEDEQFTHAIITGHDGFYGLDSLTMEDLTFEWLSPILRKNIRW